jgi:hypothetical protein
MPNVRAAESVGYILLLLSLFLSGALNIISVDADSTNWQTMQEDFVKVFYSQTYIMFEQ